MSINEVELLDRSGNFAVMRLSGRKFPGVFVQGDTMSTMRDLLKDVDGDRLTTVDTAIADQILEARDRLNELAAYYESVLDARGLQRPYF